MRSLGVEEAAALLRVHPDTLRNMARSRIIPAAKIGRSWAFLESDLLSLFEGRYQEQACPSTDKKKVITGMLTLRSPAKAGYADQLVQLIVKKRSASTTR